MSPLYLLGHLPTYCSKWVIDWQKLSTGSCQENSVATFGMKKPKKFESSFFVHSCYGRSFMNKNRWFFVTAAILFGMKFSFQRAQHRVNLSIRSHENGLEMNAGFCSFSLILVNFEGVISPFLFVQCACNFQKTLFSFDRAAMRKLVILAQCSFFMTCRSFQSFMKKTCY